MAGFFGKWFVFKAAMDAEAKAAAGREREEKRAAAERLAKVCGGRPKNE